MGLCLGLRRKQLNRPSRLLKIACLLLLVCIISCSSSQGFAGVPSGKRKSCGHKGIPRGASRWWTAFNTCDCLATRIQHAFETQMQTEDVPVLQSWDAYQSSLPVREGGDGVSRLYMLPYLCGGKELDVAVSRLEQVTKDRDRVAYLSAPTKRGKSAAILPMFCRSVELGSENSFTHYLYMPFANNDGNCHSSPMFGLRFTLRWLSRFLPWSRRWLERAGADFMLHCFRRQMKGVYSRSSTWNLPSPLPDLEDTERKFAMEVEKFLQSNQSRLLLHIDEHRSMSDSPEFRRGAMQLAGSVPARCRVIATYLEPPDLPAQGSSTVCRFPIAMMLVDVGSLLTSNASDIAPATAAGLPKIRLPAGVWNGKARRLLATLRVKLSLFLMSRNIGLDQLHIKQDDRSELRNAFVTVQEALDADTDIERKLMKAITSISFILPQGKHVSGAVDLLLGIEDSEADGRRYPGLVSLDNQKLSLPFQMLMVVRDRDVNDETFNLFCDGQDILVSSILGNSDWCDGLVMERAYAWALACKAAKADGRFHLKDAGHTFSFRCKKLRDGIKQLNGKDARVFTKKGTPSVDGIRCIEDGIMYHALSEGGKAGTHKGFDIWFKTKADELVLLDVTGATNAGTCKAKAEQIAQNAAAVMNEVQMQNATVLVESVICVLLAPNCDSAIEEPPSAQVVQGDAARDLLGGLQQLLTWLGEDVD